MRFENVMLMALKKTVHFIILIHYVFISKINIIDYYGSGTILYSTLSPQTLHFIHQHFFFLF